MRMYPIVPMSCERDGRLVVEDRNPGGVPHLHRPGRHSLACDEVFPDPYTFDIDRYLPPRDEHLSPGYAPFGLGTHTCLGSRWMDLHLAVNLLLLAHHFTIEVSPANCELRIKSLPSMSPGKKLKFVIAEQRRELSV